MARTMFNEDPDMKIFRVVVEAMRRDGEVDVDRSEVLGPYTSKPTAQGVLTGRKKDLDEMIVMSERNENVYNNPRPFDVVSYKARIEEGFTVWEAVRGSAVYSQA
ncbi:Hypothetical Protein OBI_RACECAR_286 [Arthrobacter phage Racecar]|nr:hypothetical protein PBI_RACECAR_78 [Arthrobacter phage Racecar]